jgi:hypothetical protein
MYGNHAIRNINDARVHDAITALQAKADEAKAQNHPRAAVFQAQADQLKAENSH